MNAAPAAALCITTAGERFGRFRDCLESVLATTPPDAVEWRLAFCQAQTAFHYALGRLLPDGVTPQYARLPGGVERYTWAAPGPRVWLWDIPVRADDDSVDRLLYHDVTLTADYVVRLGDETLVAPGWWEALAPVRESGVDYAGREAWLDYGPGQPEAVRAQPWYRGLPFAARNGRLGIPYVPAGFLLIRARCLREANYPAVTRWPRSHPLARLPREALLGEMARQLDWSRAPHDHHITFRESLP